MAVSSFFFPAVLFLCNFGLSILFFFGRAVRDATSTIFIITDRPSRPSSSSSLFIFAFPQPPPPLRTAVRGSRFSLVRWSSPDDGFGPLLPRFSSNGGGRRFEIKAAACLHNGCGSKGPPSHPAAAAPLISAGSKGRGEREGWDERTDGRTERKRSSVRFRSRLIPPSAAFASHFSSLPPPSLLLSFSFPLSPGFASPGCLSSFLSASFPCSEVEATTATTPAAEWVAGLHHLPAAADG